MLMTPTKGVVLNTLQKTKADALIGFPMTLRTMSRIQVFRLSFYQDALKTQRHACFD